MILELALVGAVGGLLGRAVFWHVPIMIRWLWKNRPRSQEVVLDLSGVAQAIKEFSAKEAAEAEAREAALFAECPSAFWLDPERYQFTWDTWFLPVGQRKRVDGRPDDPSIVNHDRSWALAAQGLLNAGVGLQDAARQSAMNAYDQSMASGSQNIYRPSSQRRFDTYRGRRK